MSQIGGGLTDRQVVSPDGPRGTIIRSKASSTTVAATMTTAIALETSKGELSIAMALGIILIALSMVVSGLTLFFGRALTAR